MSPFPVKPPPPPPPPQLPAEPLPSGMPRIAIWAYIFSFLFSPLGLVLCVITLMDARHRPRATGLMVFSIFVSLCYLALFVTLRLTY